MYLLGISILPRVVYTNNSYHQLQIIQFVIAFHVEAKSLIIFCVSFFLMLGDTDLALKAITLLKFTLLARLAL